MRAGAGIYTGRIADQAMAGQYPARRVLVRGLLAACALAAVRPYEALALGVTYTTPVEACFRALLATQAVAETLGDFGTNAPHLFEMHKRLAAMPRRGRLAARRDFMLGALRETGLAQARLDETGNVIAVFPGSLRAPRLLLAARLDAADQGRGVLVLLAVLRALQARPMQAVGDMVFAGLGEGGAGERCLAHALGEAGQVDGLLLLDGSGARIDSLRQELAAGAAQDNAKGAARKGRRAPAQAAGSRHTDMDGKRIEPSPGDATAQASDAPLPAAARRAAQLMGIPMPLEARHPAIALAQARGIPAAVLSDGRLDESLPRPGQPYQPGNEWKGPQTLFLAALALCGLLGVSEPLLPARQGAATPLKP
jgi:hypothetical protein